jgi:hypothetical protein
MTAQFPIQAVRSLFFHRASAEIEAFIHDVFLSAIPELATVTAPSDVLLQAREPYERT